MPSFRKGSYYVNTALDNQVPFPRVDQVNAIEDEEGVVDINFERLEAELPIERARTFAGFVSEADALQRSQFLGITGGPTEIVSVASKRA